MRRLVHQYDVGTAFKAGFFGGRPTLFIDQGTAGTDVPYDVMDSIERYLQGSEWLCSCLDVFGERRLRTEVHFHADFNLPLVTAVRVLGFPWTAYKTR
ncbi:hypothetical protein VTJ04DRAFT_3525 [Mycothermus thermophilus]|uniref:uncharacterized protein n=1 Tax=Humicola insolens TaxID=85995 RepID=UPI003743989C